LLLLGSALALGAWACQASLTNSPPFNPDGWGLLQRWMGASLHPQLDPGFLRLTLEAAATTLAYAAGGTLLSLLLGAVGGVLAAEVGWQAVRPAWRRPARQAVRSLLVLPRATHEILWGLLWVNVWGPEPLAALAAIALPYGAIAAKVFAQILDETPRQPLAALQNSGVATPAALAYAIVAPAAPRLLSYTLYRFECAIRSAAVLGIVGAGGLGYQILLSARSLRYEQLWTLFYALVLLVGLVDAGSALLRRRLARAPRHGSLLPDAALLLAAPVTLALGAGSWFWLQPDWGQLWAPASWQHLGTLVATLSGIDWAGTPWGQLLASSGRTLAMSVLAIAIATAAGTALALLAARSTFLPGGWFDPGARSRGWGAGVALGATRLLLLFGRAIPAPMWALVVLFVTFPGLWPGAIALGIYNGGVLGRLMAESCENLESGLLRALSAQGAPPASAALYGALPLMLPRLAGYSLYRWETCIRDTLVVGLVGAGGLGHSLAQHLSSLDGRGIVTHVDAFVALTLLADALSERLRRSLR